jgi:hypothetical protein
MSSADFKRGLSQAQRAEVDHHIAEGRGLAIYENDRGRPVVMMTFGTRDADLPGLPPKMYGGGTLSSYVPAAAGPTRPMRSPLMDAVGGPPQVHRPRVAPSRTEYPSVQLEMRTSQFPRGNSEYITPGRISTEVEVQQEPPEPEGEKSWYAARLARGT